MSKPAGSWLIPAGTFIIAVMLSLLAGPSSAARGLRAPMAVTPADNCHVFKETPGDVNCHSVTNGVVDNPPDCTRFNAGGVGGRFWYVEKTDDGSIIVHAAAAQGGAAQSGKGDNKRNRVGDLVKPPPKNDPCCHTVNSELKAEAKLFARCGEPDAALQASTSAILGEMLGKRIIDGCGVKGQKLSDDAKRKFKLLFAVRHNADNELVVEGGGEVDSGPGKATPVPLPEVGQETQVVIGGTTVVLTRVAVDTVTMSVPLVLAPPAAGGPGTKFRDHCELDWKVKDVQAVATAAPAKGTATRCEVEVQTFTLSE